MPKSFGDTQADREEKEERQMVHEVYVKTIIEDLKKRRKEGDCKVTPLPCDAETMEDLILQLHSRLEEKSSWEQSAKIAEAANPGWTATRVTPMSGLSDRQHELDASVTPAQAREDVRSERRAREDRDKPSPVGND